MCDFSGKLIAWLDSELPVQDANEVERHLPACSECRSQLEAYKKISAELEAYCDAAITPNAGSGTPAWIPAVSAVGATAALAALFLLLPRTRVEPPSFHPSPEAAEASSPAVAKAFPAAIRPIQRVHRRPAIAPTQVQNSDVALKQNQNFYLLPEEPVIQIAIPADEIFPPGAVPEGMNFSADLAIAADGSADGLRLRPRLIGFERRTTQP